MVSDEKSTHLGGAYQIRFFYDASKLGASITRMGDPPQTLSVTSPEFTDETSKRKALLNVLAQIGAAIVSKEDPTMPLGGSSEQPPEG